MRAKRNTAIFSKLLPGYSCIRNSDMTDFNFRIGKGKQRKVLLYGKSTVVFQSGAGSRVNKVTSIEK
ncbi:MAG: hypothetical protein AAF717_16485 [Bacteroidota bacterium]